MPSLVGSVGCVKRRLTPDVGFKLVGCVLAEVFRVGSDTRPKVRAQAVLVSGLCVGQCVQ
jgi:hypothetical protein